MVSRAGTVVSTLLLVAILVEHGLCAVLHHGEHGASERTAAGCCGGHGSSRIDRRGEDTHGALPCPPRPSPDCDHCRAHERAGWVAAKGPAPVESPDSASPRRAASRDPDVTAPARVWCFPLRPSPWMDARRTTVLLI